VGERWDQGLVEQLVPQLAVEALNEGILDRLTRGDVMPVDLHPVSEAQDGIGREGMVNNLPPSRRSIGR